jgi:hypothetical protein
METLTSLDWKGHIDAGRKYLQTACKGLDRPAVFNNVLIYHLAAMAIEKLLVGVWQYHHRMPGDHTLDGLVDGLAGICPLDKDLADGIKYIGGFDDLCPLIPSNQCAPGDTEIRTVLAVGKRVAAFAQQETNK